MKKKETEAYKIVKFPFSTEKGIRIMESENKLIFSVDNDASKAQVKESLEKMFNAKIKSINTLITNKGKRAYVKFRPETPAIEIATQLGLM